MQPVFSYGFLSTLSLRRATRPTANNATTNYEFLSTLSLRRATCVIELIERGLIFLSTLSLRRATQIKQTCRAEISISIHALLAESDSLPATTPHWQKVFLSTLSLRRATLPALHDIFKLFAFLSTLSLRRATQVTRTYRAKTSISIHALLAESDHQS